MVGLSGLISSAPTRSCSNLPHLNPATVAATKRKDEGSSPATDRRSKKVKEEDEEPGALALPYMTGRMDGPDDSVITTLFSPLFYAIIGFAATYFKGKPYKTPLKAEHKAFFETLTSGDYKDYLISKHPGAKERIVQAVVWNKLIVMLLDAPLRAFLSIPEGLIKNHVSGRFGAVLNLAYYDSPIPLCQLHGTLTLGLAVIDDREILENDLDGIVEHAYQLAKAMARSGAHWMCTLDDPRIGKLHGFKIKSDRMEELELWDNEEVRRLVVDLVVAPMLLRSGDSSGRNFESCRVFRKAEVITVPETKPKKGKA